MLLAVTTELLKDTAGEPDAKCVNWPVITTLVSTCPCWPLFGLIAVIAGRLIVYAAVATALSSIAALYAIALIVCVLPAVIGAVYNVPTVWLGVLPSMV